MLLHYALFAAAGLSALADVAAAQVRGQNPNSTVDELVVTALPLSHDSDEVTTSVHVLAGDELVLRRQSTLGDTLNGIPGVNSDTFGGGASRPVIRGQTAPRVTVLSSGSSLMDASAVSPDHAVTSEPLLIDRIEILRGPSALLYGGGAIGGAVNLVDRKIPTRPVAGLMGEVEIRGGTVDDEGAGVASLTAGVGALALHVEAAARRASDYKVPDWSEDRVDGSFSRSRSGAVGASWVGENGYIGLAYSEIRSRYGLPGHSHEYEGCHPHGSTLHCGGHDDHDDHDHEHEEGGDVPVVDLTSRRWDLRGELRTPVSGIELVRLRAGRTDYKHDELDEGEVQTTFSNKGYDGRLEVVHAQIAGLRGVIGAQTTKSDFSAVGAESYLQASRTRSSAIFLLEEWDAGALHFEGALRQEWQEARAVGRVDTDHKPLSASIAGSWTFAPGYAASLSFSRSQRAPTAQELYSRGVHLATNTYEIGAPTLKAETAKSVELTLRRTEGATTFSASAYRYGYDGYIYADTLDQFEDFRLIRYAQADATFTGLEGEARHQFAQGFGLGLFGDYVRAKLADGGGNLPRIPAGRLGVRADGQRGAWSGNLELYRAFKQSDAAEFETVTPAYNMLNATLSHTMKIGPTRTQVFVRGANLLDELALNHASFVKTSAPLRGRNLTVGVRAAF